MEEHAAMPPILMTIPEAAAFIARSRRCLYDMIATGQIKAVKSDKCIRVVVSSLHEYVAGLPAPKIKPTTTKRERLRKRQSETVLR